MYKDEGTIHIDKLSSTPTTEDNGLEVSVTLERNYANSDAIKEGIYLLAFFPQIYVQNNTSLTLDTATFNARKIRKHRHYSYYLTEDNYQIRNLSYTSYREYKVLYGNVLYPIHFPSHLNIEYLPLDNLYLQFDIGELDITPSREALQMTKRTIAAIENKLTEYNKEIEADLHKYFGAITSVGQILNAINTDGYGDSACKLVFDKIDNTQIELITTSEFLATILNGQSPILRGAEGDVKISGKLLSAYFNKIVKRGSLEVMMKKYNKYNNRLQIAHYMSTSRLLEAIHDNLYVVTDDSVNKLVVAYLKEPRKEFWMLTKEDEKKLLTSIQNGLHRAMLTFPAFNEEQFNALVYGTYRWYCSKRKSINKRRLPKDFLARYKAAHPTATREKKVVEKEDIVFYGLTYDDRLTRLDGTFLKSFKGTVVVLDKSSAYIPVITNMFRWFSGSNDYISLPNLKLMFVAVASRNLTACKELGFIDVIEFFNNETNSLFHRLAAIKLWTDINKVHISSLKDSLNRTYILSKVLDDSRATYLRSIYSKYINPLAYYNLNSDDCSWKETLDACIQNGFVDWKFYSKLPTISELRAIDAYNRIEPRNMEQNALLMMELMKKKLIPMNFVYFNKSKALINECIKGRW